MNRRKFLGTVAGSAAIGTIGFARGEEEESTKDVTLVRTPAVIMAPRKDGIELVWAVSNYCRGYAEWKSEDDDSRGHSDADRFGMVPQGKEILRVRVNDLKPGTNYSVRAVTEMGDVRVESEWKKFRTLDPEAESTSFVVWNDTHQNEETIKTLNKNTPKGDFLLWNGDTCNDWHDEDWLVPTLLNPAGQDISKGRPMFLVWGNHDVRGKWAYRVPELIATPENRPYYAFRSGPLAVICLHTGEDKPDTHPSFGGRVAFDTLRAEQAEWLKEITARPEFKDAPNKLVFCHIPLRLNNETILDADDYVNGAFDHYSKRSRDAWHDILVEWGAQIIVSGHTHQHDLVKANEDFPYTQLIGGGPRPETATWIEGKADKNGLELVVKNLEGKELHKVHFDPIA